MGIAKWRYGGEGRCVSNATNKLLITIDPTSLARPDKTSVAAHVNHWIDVDAVTTGALNVGNGAAGVGGAWDTFPKGAADEFISAAADHEEFRKVMNTPGPDGITPMQALERVWVR